MDRESTADTVDIPYGRPTVTEDLSNSVVVVFRETLQALQRMHSEAIITQHREPTSAEE